MAYEVFLKLKDRDLSLDSFQDLFSRRKNCRANGDEQVIYENPDTGVGFYFEYMHEEKKGEANVRADGVYRVALCVEYCQPAFFFVEALYEIFDLVEQEGFVVYDPQIGGRAGGGVFDDKKLFENWIECNILAVHDYMMSLGPEMDDVPVMPYGTLREMWKWNYSIESLRKTLDKKMQIPTIQCVEFEGEDLTAVIWKEGDPIAIPYVDVVIFARRKNNSKADDKNQDYEFCAIDYEDVKPLIEKYSESFFMNAFLLDYDETPKEIEKFITAQDPGVEFLPMNMCDVLEYEVAEKALFPDMENPIEGK